MHHQMMSHHSPLHARFTWQNSPSVLTPAAFLLSDWSQPYTISQIDTLHSRILSAQIVMLSGREVTPRINIGGSKSETSPDDTIRKGIGADKRSLSRFKKSRIKNLALRAGKS